MGLSMPPALDELCSETSDFGLAPAQPEFTLAVKTSLDYSACQA